MEGQTVAQAHPLEVQLESIRVPRPGRRGLPVLPLVQGDERLARAVKEGNERAFDALFTRYHQQLYRYCHSMLRHEADAQDALQSTFTAALVALRRGQRDAPLRPWLFRIAHNESVSLLRRRRPAAELPEDLTSTLGSPEDLAQDRARLAQLVDDLRMLPERQRGALIMRELSGLSHEDMAHALGISAGAAKQTVFEARRALQEFAEGRAMACEAIQRTLSNGDRRALRSRRLRAHLRDCGSCSTFEAMIPERRAALMALSPALPASAAAGLLGKITGVGSAHHSGGGGGLLASATGKSMGLAVSAKSLATGAAIVATAAAGTVGGVEIATHAGRSTARPLGSARSASLSAGAHQSRGASATKSLAMTGVAGHRGQNSGASGPGARGGSAHGHASGSLASAAGRSSSSTKSSSGSGAGGGSSLTNPNAHGGNPNARGGNPNAGGGNSNSSGGNPNAHGGNPNAGGGNAHPGGGSSNAHGGNPNAGGGNPNAGGGNVNAGGGNPNAGGGNAHTGGGSSNAHGGNPNAGGGNPNAHGGKSHG